MSDNPTGAPAASESVMPSITVLTSTSAPLNKRFEWQDGKIVKTSNATFCDGEARTIEAPDPGALNAIIESFSEKQCLSVGILKNGPVQRISTRNRAMLGTVARTLEHFTYLTGPGWMLWDYDDKDITPGAKARIQHHGGPLQALFAIAPELKAAPHLIRPSSSGGIVRPDGVVTENAGLHGFFLIDDVSRSKQILEDLQNRAWADGMGWFALSASGSILIRSLVDVAVGSPERLIFAAPPTVIPPLTRTPKPPVIFEAEAPATLPAPDRVTLAKAEQAMAEAREKIAPAAAAKRKAWMQATGRKNAEAKAAKASRPVTEEMVEEEVRKVEQMIYGAILDDDQILQLADGSEARVGDVLDAAEKWHGAAIPDPVEGVSYGRDKATLLLLKRPGHPDDKPRLVSHAHGLRTVYRFARHEAKAEGEKPRTSRFFRASEWKGQPVPEREWVVPEIVPAGDVTLLGGDGGTGKSLLAYQLAFAVATGAPWIGQPVKRGAALMLTAEDTGDELHRRVDDMLRAGGKPYDDLSDLHVRSLAGEDALLATMDRNTGALRSSRLYAEIEAYITETHPKVVILDTLADLFPGNENDRAQARQFVGMVRHVAIKHGCGIVLLQHPSLTGLNSGSGTSGSTGWNNSVRSRIYLERIKEDGAEPDPNARVLRTMKANYGKIGGTINLTWKHGVFIGIDPSDEDDRLAKACRVFLNLLDEFAARGEFVKVKSDPCALKVFAATKNRSGVTKADFQAAMRRLLDEDVIREVRGGGGPPSKQTLRIVRMRSANPDEGAM